MTEIERTGPTVDDAVAAALSDLGVTRDRATIDVLQQADSGLFGLIGGQPARVRVTVDRSKAEYAEDLLNDLLQHMPLPVYVEAIDEDDDHIFVRLGGDDLGRIIGHHGRTLNALQFLVNVAAANHSKEPKKVVIDVEDYRERRQEVLRRVAQRKARQVRRQQAPLELEPMSAYERKAVHLAIKEEQGVDTYSVGDEPYRKVVIAPQGADAAGG